MKILRVALAGASGSGKSGLAAALTRSLQACGWPAAVQLADPTVAGITQDGGALTLLMGLEGLESSTDDAHAADQRVRLALARADTAYAVLYGCENERLLQALGLIEKRLMQAGTQPLAANNTNSHNSHHKPWVWVCDKCSDPLCEHKLLTHLLAQRPTALAPQVAEDGQSG